MKSSQSVTGFEAGPFPNLPKARAKLKNSANLNFQALKAYTYNYIIYIIRDIENAGEDATKMRHILVLYDTVVFTRYTYIHTIYSCSKCFEIIID